MAPPKNLPSNDRLRLLLPQFPTPVKCISFLYLYKKRTINMYIYRTLCIYIRENYIFISWLLCSSWFIGDLTVLKRGLKNTLLARPGQNCHLSAGSFGFRTCLSRVLLRVSHLVVITDAIFNQTNQKASKILLLFSSWVLLHVYVHNGPFFLHGFCLEFMHASFNH